MLFSTPVICAAPATCPTTISDDWIFCNVRPANGVPLEVGSDISTMHRLSFVREPDDVARDAEEGSIMCRPLWPEMFTLVASEKLGLRIGPGALDISSL